MMAVGRTVGRSAARVALGLAASALFAAPAAAQFKSPPIKYPPKRVAPPPTPSAPPLVFDAAISARAMESLYRVQRALPPVNTAYGAVPTIDTTSAATFIDSTIAVAETLPMQDRVAFLQTLIAFARWDYCAVTGYYVRGIAEQNNPYGIQRRKPTKPEQCHTNPRFQGVVRNNLDYLVATGTPTQPIPNLAHKGVVGVLYGEIKAPGNFGDVPLEIGLEIFLMDGGDSLHGRGAAEMFRIYDGMRSKVL